MKVELSQKGETTPVELPEGVCWAGGSAGDQVRIEGLPPRYLELRVDAGRLTVRCRETLSINEVFVPSNVPRLMVAGERIHLPGEIELRMPQAKPVTPGTAAVLKELLAGPSEPEIVRAANLTCLTGSEIGRRFPIAGSAVVVGRGPEAQIRLRDRAVSRVHAKIRKGPEAYYIEDLSTPNGLYVNGVRARTIRALVEGDIIELGRSLLRFSAGVPEPVPAPAPAPAKAASPTPSPTPSQEAPTKRKKSFRMDWALIGMGIALAAAGALVTFGFAA